MSESESSLKAWTDNAASIGRALLVMVLAWIGSLAWRTYESVQESRAQSQVILLRMEKFASLERQVADALLRIEKAAGLVASMDARLMVIESRVSDHERKFDAYRGALLRIEELRGRPILPEDR